MNSKNPTAESKLLHPASANPKTLDINDAARHTSTVAKALGSPSYARAHVHSWRASMAVWGKNLPEKMSEKAARRFPSAVRGVTPVAASAARRSGGCCGCEGSAVPSCVRRRGGKCAGRKKGLPRSPIYRGGVVTAPVTTPPGSPAPWEFGGLRVAAQARVYA